MIKYKNHIIKILMMLIFLITLILIFPYSYSKYESEAESEVVSKVAYYILNTTYQTSNIKINDLEPRDAPYIYQFSIANNKDSKRLETNLEYELLIKTTTNLPLTYKLYMNEDYNNPLSENIIMSEDIVTDEYGTHMKEIKVPTAYFSYHYDEVNIYTLLVYFPKTYISYKYHNMVDSIEIIINSKQISE